MSVGAATDTSTVQQQIITTLDGATTAGRRIYYGSRLQTSLLPALTFEISSVDSVSIGNSALSAFAVTFTAVADSASDAVTLGESIAGILGSDPSWQIIQNGRVALQETQPENGEEAGLYLANLGFTIYA